MPPEGQTNGTRVQPSGSQMVPLRVAADDSEASATDDSNSDQPQHVCNCLEKHKWKILFFLMAVFIIAFIIGRVSIRCGDVTSKLEECRSQPPPGWIWYSNYGYYYSNEKLNWLSSKMFCEKQGATLAVLKDDFMKENVKRLKADSDDHWYGRYKMDGKLKWLNGSSVIEDEKLNKISGQNCGTWNPGEELEADCSSEKPFICIAVLLRQVPGHCKV